MNAMRAALFSVPYEAGTRASGVGRGAAALKAAGLPRRLRSSGIDVQEHDIELAADSPAHELARIVGLQCAIATAVQQAVARGEFPVVIAGNCSSAVGVLAGLPHGSAIAWFDAHADFNTPETTQSGMVDGMALAMSTGRCLRALAATVPNFAPIAEDKVVLIGARDLDPAEEIALAGSPIARVSADHIDQLSVWLAATLGKEPSPLYLHLDLDVLDPAVARANRFAAPGGLTSGSLLAAIEALAATGIAGMAVTAYDPGYDPDGRTAAIAIEAVDTALRGRTLSPRARRSHS